MKNDASASSAPGSSGPSEDLTALRLEILGQVQGVGFRAWLAELAADMQVAGWVRNRSDGSVEAQVEGPQIPVMRVAERCWHGPAAARVDEVKIYPIEPQRLTGFRQRATD